MAGLSAGGDSTDTGKAALRTDAGYLLASLCSYL